MSRSLGDIVATHAGVIHKPEIKQFKIEDTDRAIILATDGVWEFMTNKLVTKAVIDAVKRRDPEAACKKVISESVRYWKAKDTIIDDISVICVILPTKSKPSNIETSINIEIDTKSNEDDGEINESIRAI